MHSPSAAFLKRMDRVRAAPPSRGMTLSYVEVSEMDMAWAEHQRSLQALFSEKAGPLAIVSPSGGQVWNRSPLDDGWRALCFVPSDPSWLLLP
jgi:hypothetical protein